MKQDFFQANRQRLLDLSGQSIVVLSGYTAMQRSNDTAFTFAQEANFWWLTGISEPDWQIVLDPSLGKTWLVRPGISDVHQMFDGSISTDEALMLSGADGVLSKEQASETLQSLAKQYDTVMTLGPDPYRSHFDFVENPAPARLRRQLKKVFKHVKDCRPAMSKLRAIKQPDEIAVIQKAVDLTIEGFELVHNRLQEGIVTSEYEIEAEFSYLFTKSGHGAHAYDPIIASGKNACTLHYSKNVARLRSGLLLMDVGARVDGYAADITRTFAVGTVSDRQRHVHHAVQTAHHQIVDLLHPGLAVSEYLSSVDEIMKQALSSLGLLEKPSDYRTYFPHAISHGLGVDVHDNLGGPKTFQPGMVLTVEPGIYIPAEDIGVRIEDDILITDTGHRNLSARLTTDL